MLGICNCFVLFILFIEIIVENFFLMDNGLLSKNLDMFWFKIIKVIFVM